MTVEDFIYDISKQLELAGVETSRLDCLVLLEDTLGHNRANLLAHPELEIPAPLLDKLNNLVTQRKMHTPLAYIRGKSAFYGRDFIVNKQVLVPRPESESMIEILKQLPLSDMPVIADVGCGSGCLGITAKLEIPKSEVTLYDVSKAALQVARSNSHKLGADVEILSKDLLEGIDQMFDVVLANLPYVPDDYSINKAAAHEPRLALFAGIDGLDLYRRMFMQLAKLGAKKPQYILTEALPSQLNQLEDIAKTAGYSEKRRNGLVQLFS